MVPAAAVTWQLMTETPSTRPIDIGSNGGTIDVVADTTLTHEGSMTGTGKLTKIGTGTFSVGQLTNYSVAVGTTGVPTNKFGSPSYYNFNQLTPGSGGTQVVTNSFGPTNSMTVTFDDVAVSGQNYYFRWTMDTRMKHLAQGKNVRTIGVTMVRFDPQGRVILHQDFWDSAQGVWNHVPGVGAAIRWIQSKI